ncbi:hypothetical protein ACFE04_026942 [Oxalis oulophora]
MVVFGATSSVPVPVPVPGPNMFDCCCTCSSLKLNPPKLKTTNTSWSKKSLKKACTLQVYATQQHSYNKFIQFALDETKLHTHLVSSPLKEKYNSVLAMDGKTEIQMVSYQAPKVRLLRNLSIENESMQVMDFGVFPKPEFDIPIFCANFFSTASMNIIVLDLNPLHDVIAQRDYRDKYYKSLIPLGVKYAELLPWGGKLTSESLKFFSPIVIWTRFASSPRHLDILYSAFVEYYKAWLKLMDEAKEETNTTQILNNCEAQHRYLTWRAEKDPGHGILKRLIGETRGKDLVRNFLFYGIDELGSKQFLDYFPEYRCEDGMVSEKRSIIGKSYENRPWDARGEFIGDNIES